MVGDERQEDQRPRPDPTILTTEALHREIGHLREHVDQKFESHGQLDGEKLARIEQRFRDRELLVSAEFAASKEAVVNALASSKEAVAKSEDMFRGQIAELRRTADATNRSLEKEIGAIKDRVTIIEALDRGEEKKAAGISSTTALAISVLVVVISAIGVVSAIVLNVSG